MSQSSKQNKEVSQNTLLTPLLSLILATSLLMVVINNPGGDALTAPSGHFSAKRICRPVKMLGPDVLIDAL